MSKFSELNSDLTLDYTQSSLPSTTDINSFLQMVLERLYPSTPVALIPIMVTNTNPKGTASLICTTPDTSSINIYNNGTLLQHSATYEQASAYAYEIFKEDATSKLELNNMSYTEFGAQYVFDETVTVTSILLGRLTCGDGGGVAGSGTVVVSLRNASTGVWSIVYNEVKTSVFDLSGTTISVNVNNVDAIKVSMKNGSGWNKDIGAIQAYGYTN